MVDEYMRTYAGTRLNMPLILAQLKYAEVKTRAQAKQIHLPFTSRQSKVIECVRGRFKTRKEIKKKVGFNPAREIRELTEKGILEKKESPGPDTSLQRFKLKN
jgi:hypothetical protein